ncbi:MAG: DNA-formamidopyrimidine glycosylase, partial [Chloroflexi bacterium]|nr:DNA-formamidopyrimidine glycosylase [Chloroflexota bacterium]
MPELPEVETIARGLRKELTGRTIESAEVLWARTIARPSSRKFTEQVRGQRITGVSRRAKFLVLQLEAYNLLIHLRMSGDLVIRKGKK